MAEPRKHHYLPQFYLRGFSGNGKQIFQIEKREARGYLCSIRDAAAIRDYHNLDHDDAEDPYALEKRLSDIEDQLAKALAEVIRSGIVSDISHARLVEFVSLMRVRVPAFKQHIEESLRQVVRSTGKILELKGKLPPPPKGLVNTFAGDGITISISNWKCLEYMFGLASDKEILRLLASMTPSILRAPQGKVLLTCDQPVAVFNPEADPANAYGIGLAHPRTQISFPLSSGVLLLLTWDQDAVRERLLLPDEVNEFNRRSAVMAEALLFAPKQSEAAIEVVAQNKHCSAGIALQVLNTGDSALHMSTFRPVMPAERYQAAPNSND
jgi:hypothetical protein